MILSCPNEFGIYDGKIYLEFPRHMLYEYGGFYNNKRGCLIDLCIVEEIKYLWSLGITTYGSCCGHGINAGMINVDKKDVELMIKLGYKKVKTQRDCYPYTFIPKSKHRNVHMFE